jgi:polysaccharide deacetylase 2 family uncharacterized protein YibQ
LRLAPGLVAGLLAAGGVIGLSLYTMRENPELQQTAEVAVPAEASSSPETPSPAGRPEEQGMQTTSPTSGAKIERTLTDDGTVVTKYSPRPRDGTGPILVETPRTGQDPRLAGTPNEDLLEDTPYGPLPIVGPDGLRPMDQYARPWSGARGTRIAIILGGLGLSQTGTQKAIRQLPGEITLAFAASGNSLQRWMQVSRRDGHEILLQIPMEPFGFSATDSDPMTLLADASAEENLGKLHEAMARITGYTGIMTHLGGRLLSDVDALEPLLRDIGERGLLFLDDGSSARSASGTVAKALALPHGFADLALDGQLEKNAILKKLDELERIALRKGTAVGVASAFDESVDAIAQWTQEAQGRGIEIVGISALVEDPADF